MRRESVRAETGPTRPQRRGGFDDVPRCAIPSSTSYADFRAAGERVGAPLARVAERPRLSSRTVRPTRPRSATTRYVQFVAAEQLAAAATPVVATRAGLYLDLPVGVHPDGFDTWSRADLFAPATVGAPPDRLAPQGQAWGFPPLHPQRIRQSIATAMSSAAYRHLLAQREGDPDRPRARAATHVLDPAGAGAESGAYVRYPPRRADGDRRDRGRARERRGRRRGPGHGAGRDPGARWIATRMLHSFVYQFAATAQRPAAHSRRRRRSRRSAATTCRDSPASGAAPTSTIGSLAASRREAAAQAERAERRRLVDAVAGTAR